MNKNGKRVVIYLHPWEFCPELPKVKTSLVGKITAYWGLKNNINKLEYILKRFKFASFKEILGYN